MFKKNIDDVVIISGVRTPFGRFGGTMKDMDIVDLSADVMKAALERASLKPEQVDEVWWGCGDTSNTKDVFTPVIGRQSLLKAGMPPNTPCCTFDKACVSGTSAVMYALRAIKTGEAEIVLAGGATHFSSVPFLLRDIRFQGHRIGAIKMEDPLFPLGYKDFAPVAVDSGRVAVLHGITRQMQDEWAAASHAKYGKAWNEGKYKDEMLPLEFPQKDGKVKVLDIDEQYRSDSTVEKLAKLAPIFDNIGGVTAGNAPGLNDGAVALIITSRTKAEKLGIKPLATIITMASIGADPTMLPIAPALAIKKCFEKTGLTMDDMDLLEINEAFACVPLVSSKILAENDENKWDLIKNKMNVNGGAVAVGHANCASGARLLLALMYELKRRGGGIGAIGICGGLTQGDAAIIQVED
ncbi:MAG: thiolase family protein [Syntrophomonadaceae bacterium]|nr:thiolase family protein [Syntrophomonadaceae bacterium]